VILQRKLFENNILETHAARKMNTSQCKGHVLFFGLISPFLILRLKGNYAIAAMVIIRHPLRHNTTGIIHEPLK
jgi:hypothetical protein